MIPLIKKSLFRSLEIFNRQSKLKTIDSFILVYHRVVDDNEYVTSGFQPNATFQVKRRHFESQIKFLKKNYEILPLNGLIGLLKKRDDITGKIAITFDDGYRDNYEYAYPILKDHKVPATIYLLGSIFNEDDILLWWLQLEEIISTAKTNDIRFKFMDTKYAVSLKSNNSKMKFFVDIGRQLLDRRPIEQRDLLSALASAAGIKKLSDHRGHLLSFEMIKEMKGSGLISFGSHTYSHCALKFLSNRDLKQDIFDSKRVIESHLGETVMSLAFPYGKKQFIDERVLRNIKKAGYMYAVTTIPGGLVNRRDDNLHLLPRVSMDGCSSIDDLQIRTSRIYNRIKYFVT